MLFCLLDNHKRDLLRRRRWRNKRSSWAFCCVSNCACLALCMALTLKSELARASSNVRASESKVSVDVFDQRAKPRSCERPSDCWSVSTATITTRTWSFARPTTLAMTRCRWATCCTGITCRSFCSTRVSELPECGCQWRYIYIYRSDNDRKLRSGARNPGRIFCLDCGRILSKLVSVLHGRPKRWVHALRIGRDLMCSGPVVRTLAAARGLFEQSTHSTMPFASGRRISSQQFSSSNKINFEAKFSCAADWNRNRTIQCHREQVSVSAWRRKT